MTGQDQAGQDQEVSGAVSGFPADARMVFCIGAQMAGTDWLDALLRQSPDCHFSPARELHYFDVLGGVAGPVYQHRIKFAATLAARLTANPGPANRPTLLALQQLAAQLAIHSGPGPGPGPDSIQRPERHAPYLNYLLSGRRTESVVCDITPTYALLDRPMFSEMASIGGPTTGGAKFLFILRDPVDRLWAQICTTGAAQSLAQKLPPPAHEAACIAQGWALITSGRLTALDPTDQAMGRADYARTITALEAAVPVEQIKYLFYEQLFTQASADAICGFLGIAPGLTLPLPEPRSATAQPIPAALAQALRAALDPQYDFARVWFDDTLPAQWQQAGQPVADTESNMGSNTGGNIPQTGSLSAPDLAITDPALADPAAKARPTLPAPALPAPILPDPILPPAAKLRPVRAQPQFGTLRAVAALILREMSTTYGRSAGGYLWAVLEPVLSITLLTFVFSLAFRSPPLGSNFPIFYATGFMPFILYNEVSNKMSQAIGFSKQLLNFPRITFIDVMVARMLLAVLTKLLVSYLIFLGILSLYDTGTRVDLPHVLLSFAMAAAFGIGVGTMNCFLMSMFPVWRQAWSIVTTPLVLISGVIVMVDSLPDQYLYYLTFNPLVHITAEMRLGFYYSYTAPYISPVYVFAVSLVLTAVGLLFLRRYYRDILE